MLAICLNQFGAPAAGLERILIDHRTDLINESARYGTSHRQRVGKCVSPQISFQNASNVAAELKISWSFKNAWLKYAKRNPVQ